MRYIFDPAVEGTLTAQDYSAPVITSASVSYDDYNNGFSNYFGPHLFSVKFALLSTSFLEVLIQ